MGNFDKAPKSKTMAIVPIPDRLTRLDNDLESGSKQIDFVFAVRNNGYETYRIRVAVTYLGEYAQAQSGFKYTASAFVGGKKHRSYGHRPSHAFIKIVEQLRWTTSKLTWQKNTKQEAYGTTSK